MPDRRKGYIQKATVGDRQIYTGEYDDDGFDNNCNINLKSVFNICLGFSAISNE